MAATTFATAHPWVLAHEGGYVDHPADPGGATNQGVTQATYDAWRQRKDQARRSVRHITPAERDAIYRNDFWDAIRGDDLPAGVDYATYDFAVNSGPSRAARYLQRIVGTKQDGIIGPLTLAAVTMHDPEHVVRRLCDDRMAFLRRLRHWGTFGRGWTRRVMGQKDGFQDDDHGVIDRGVMLARGADDIEPPKAPAPGKGYEEAVGEPVTPEATVVVAPVPESQVAAPAPAPAPAETKPAVKSKTVWAGAIVTVVSLVSLVVQVATGDGLTAADTEELTALLTSLVTTVGGLLAIYGRVTATKKVG
jgi:hypothetical protein